MNDQRLLAVVVILGGLVLLGFARAFAEPPANHFADWTPKYSRFGIIFRTIVISIFALGIIALGIYLLIRSLNPAAQL